MSAAYCASREVEAATPARGGVRAEFEIRNDSRGNLARRRRLRRRLSPLRRRNRHADRGRRARLPGARCRARGNRARVGWTSSCPPENGRYQALISPMREGVCWYYERGWPFLLVEAAVREGAGAPGARSAWPRAPALRRERAVRAAGPRVRLPVADHLAQSRADPRHGAARHPGPLPRLVRRRLLDRHQPPAADADLLLRLRPGAARALPGRPQPLRLRALFPGRHAALAGLQRGRGPRAHGACWSIAISSRSWSSRWKRCPSTWWPRAWSSEAVRACCCTAHLPAAAARQRAADRRCGCPRC